MNSVYHMLAPSKEEFDRKLQAMIDEEDPALCCASVVWRPSQLTDYYKTLGWEGQSLGKVFKNLGVQRASVMFWNLVIKRGLPEKDAWFEVYSKEVALSS